MISALNTSAGSLLNTSGESRQLNNSGLSANNSSIGSNCSQGNYAILCETLSEPPVDLVIQNMNRTSPNPHIQRGNSPIYRTDNSLFMSSTNPRRNSSDSTLYGSLSITEARQPTSSNVCVRVGSVNTNTGPFHSYSNSFLRPETAGSNSNASLVPIKAPAHISAQVGLPQITRTNLQSTSQATSYIMSNSKPQGRIPSKLGLSDLPRTIHTSMANLASPKYPSVGKHGKMKAQLSRTTNTTQSSEVRNLNSLTPPPPYSSVAGNHIASKTSGKNLAYLELYKENGSPASISEPNPSLRVSNTAHNSSIGNASSSDTVGYSSNVSDHSGGNSIDRNSVGKSFDLHPNHTDVPTINIIETSPILQEAHGHKQDSRNIKNRKVSLLRHANHSHSYFLFSLH